MRCYYDKLTGSVITSLHVDSDDMLNSIDKHEVTDANGNTVVAAEQISASDSFQKSKLQVTYATTRNNYKEMVIHMHNYHGDDTATVHSRMGNGILIIFIQVRF